MDFNLDGWLLKLQSPNCIYSTSTGKTLFGVYTLFVKRQLNQKQRIIDTSTSTPDMVFISQAFGEARVNGKGSLDLPRLQQQMRYTALVRCGKDLGIASELWDPAWHYSRKIK